MCSRIARNHPLPDGNKRVGWLAMREFMERNGMAWQAPSPEEVDRAVRAVASGVMSEPAFAQWVAAHVPAHSPPP